MELSSNFEYNFSNILTDPMQSELKTLYDKFLDRIQLGKVYYNNLKPYIIDILLEENNPPSLEDVDLLNSDLAGLLVTLQDGGLNLGDLGQVTFGINLSGFDFDIATGQMKSMPIKTIKALIAWVQHAIEKSTNSRYLNSVLWLSKLIQVLNKTTVEKILIIMDSIKALEVEPIISINQLTEKLSSIGLSFNEDPNISKIDETIPELFVQKHLVTTKLYSAIENKIMFLGGYDPTALSAALELNLNYDYKSVY